MSELKLNLLPDLEVIEKFILDNGINEYKASFKDHIKYLYQIFKQYNLKYEYFLKNTIVDTKLALVFIEELIKNLDEIYYKLSRRINRLKTTDSYVLNNKDTQTYENTKNTKLFINDLLHCTNNIEITLLQKYIKDNKENFYFKDTIKRKLEILIHIFTKYNDIFNNLDLRYKQCTINDYFNKK